MMFTYSLDGLSTELLIKIFHHLDVPDLCRLRRTCKRLNEVITSWDYVLLKNLTPLVTNQRSTVFLSRCYNDELSQFERVRISKNWRNGRYREKSLLFVKRKYIPWLCLNNEYVWISRGKDIISYERNKNHVNINKSVFLQGNSNADVGNFQVKNNLLLSGQRDGSLWLRSLNDKKVIFDKKKCHESDINSVDISACGNTLVSGSRDNCFKIWRVDYNSHYSLNEVRCTILQDRVWRVSLLNEKPLVAVGTSGNSNVRCLFIYDLERISNPIYQLASHNFGMGILDIKWDGPHTLWSCGYDTYLKRWDLRTGNCVQIYRDPHASALYCLDYDHFNTIMTGTQLHGRVILWDIRQIHSVQLFFMNSCKNERNKARVKSSPIYSLSFDSEYLFTATDQNLNVLNFSVYDGNVNDYSFCCR